MTGLPSLRQRWNDSPAMGAWMFLREPLTAEAAARAGYDYVVIDLQHGIASEPEALAMIQGAEAGGSVPIVRVATNAEVTIGRALDLGALGVIVPMVNDAESARAAVNACRYPPVGTRSYGPVAAMARYSDVYANHANEAIVCLVMIETATALAALDEILSVPGVDGVYVGPVDLSLSLGLPPLPFHDDHRFHEAVDAILQACARHGVVPGIHASAELAPRWREKGFRVITVGYDQMSAVSGLRHDLAAARAVEPDPAAVNRGY